MEGAAERAEAVEADVEADIGDAAIGRSQQEHRALDAPALQVAVRRLAEGVAEVRIPSLYAYARAAFAKVVDDANASRGEKLPSGVNAREPRCITDVAARPGASERLEDVHTYAPLSHRPPSR